MKKVKVTTYYVIRLLINRTFIAIEPKSLYGLCFELNFGCILVSNGKKHDGKIDVGCVRRE